MVEQDYSYQEASTMPRTRLGRLLQGVDQRFAAFLAKHGARVRTSDELKTFYDQGTQTLDNVASKAVTVFRRSRVPNGK